MGIIIAKGFEKVKMESRGQNQGNKDTQKKKKEADDAHQL